MDSIGCIRNSGRVLFLPNKIFYQQRWLFKIYAWWKNWNWGVCFGQVDWQNRLSLVEN